ncbi:GNAT family N-acetyltransferase [Clostridium transplantifaecale]|uniref:GNAT family N-acetyltransferase n=1 Tax=Clostridium transplantifaecale TaxID=2479838 RepID=UPI000F638906|nr:GNAT family N-acetyltransferase [Clostridium transplantifaecale]
MTIIKEVTVEGKQYPVTVSDENEALLAAAAAGRAIVGIWDPERGGSGAGFDACLYLIGEAGAADEMLLERAVRRNAGLPWVIAETDRLLIREFTSEDPLERESPDDGGGVFSDRLLRENYIAGQYRFHECGLWALVEKQSRSVIGKAGITDGELGYHIYEPFRSQGYALEACRAIIGYAREELGLNRLVIKTESKNKASASLAQKLGFTLSGTAAEAEEGLLVFDKYL